MRTTKALFAAAIAATLAAPVAAEDVAVQITSGVGSVDVMHGSETVTIMRNQDQKNTVKSCVREDVPQMPARSAFNPRSWPPVSRPSASRRSSISRRPWATATTPSC